MPEQTEESAREVIQADREAAAKYYGVEMGGSPAFIAHVRNAATGSTNALARAFAAHRLAFANPPAQPDQGEGAPALDREEVAQIVARAYGGSLYPGLGEPGDYPTADEDYRAADAILALVRPLPAPPAAGKGE